MKKSLLQMLESILKKVVVPLESYSNDNIGELHCQIKGEGYTITIVRDKAYDKRDGE